MNENHLLFWLTDIGDEYVLEAVERFRTVQHRPRRLSRLLVIAAVVAALVAIAAGAYAVSQSIYTKKQAQLRLEYLPHGQEVPSYVEFTPTEEEPTGTHIEMLSTVRSHETMQEGRYAITTDDPVLIDALYGGAPELRCDNLFVIGGMDGKDAENNTAYYTIQMVLPEDAKPGTTYSVEVWVRHPKLWVPENDQTADPVEDPPSTGSWVQWPVCLGTLEMMVTDFGSALVEFGDSLPVSLESGAAYIRFAEIQPQGVSWIVSLPDAVPQDAFISYPIAPAYLELVDALEDALEKSALVFEDGSYLLLYAGESMGVYDEGMSLHLTCHYSAVGNSRLQNVDTVKGIAVGSQLYPVNQSYDPDAVLPAPDYETVIP